MRSGSVKKTVIPFLVCLAVAGCFKSSEERAAEHYESGIALVAEGDLDRAMVEFRNTLKFQKTNLDAHRQMADIFLQRGNDRAAYRSYLHVVESEPNDVVGRTLLSRLAFEMRNWDEFERHSEAAITLAADAPEVKAISLAAQYRNAVLNEDFTERDALLVKTEALAAEQPDSAILRQILIDGYVGTEDYEAALTVLNESIAAAPGRLELYNAKLELLVRLGRSEDVDVELRRMVVQFPEDDNIKSTLLRFLISRGKTDEAEAFLRESIATAPDPETRTGRYVSLVQFLIATKGTESALKELETGLAQEDSKQDTLRTLRATIAFDSGNRSEGIAELQDILSAETTTLTPFERQNVSVSLAKMLVVDGNEVGARKLVEEVLSSDPNSVGALKMQAVWQIREDNTGAAIAGLRTALDAAPQDAEAMGLMAEAYQRAGNSDLMLSFLSLAVDASNNAPAQSLRYAAALQREGKPLQSETILISALRITPGNVDVLTALGKIYLELEDIPRAKQVVDTLRKIETEAAQNSADALNLEVLALGSGAEEALGFLEKLAGENGASAQQAKLALLRARLQSGETDMALTFAQELVAEEPDNPQFRNALALTYAALRNYTAAETEMQALLQAEPTLVPVWLQLSRIRLAQGNSQGSIDTINAGLEANADNPDLLWAKASFLQQDGDVPAAIAIYEEMYKTFSNSPIIANNLASLLSTYRADEESIKRAQLIVRRLKDTTVPAFQDTYGWLQHLAGDSETALTYVEPAATALPNDMQVQLHLGLIYAALGRSDDAIAQLQRTITQAGPLGRQDLIEQAQNTITELQAQ